MAEHCNFEASRDEQIRDRIVIGILEKDLSQKLQLKSTLTLDQAIEMAHQSEQIKAQVTARSSKPGSYTYAPSHPQPQQGTQHDSICSANVESGHPQTIRESIAHVHLRVDIPVN